MCHLFCMPFDFCREYVEPCSSLGGMECLTKTRRPERACTMPSRTPSPNAASRFSGLESVCVTKTTGFHSRKITFPRLSLRESDASSELMLQCLPGLRFASSSPTANPIFRAMVTALVSARRWTLAKAEDRQDMSSTTGAAE